MRASVGAIVGCWSLEVLYQFIVPRVGFWDQTHPTSKWTTSLLMSCDLAFADLLSRKNIQEHGNFTLYVSSWTPHWVTLLLERQPFG